MPTQIYYPSNGTISAKCTSSKQNAGDGGRNNTLSIARGNMAPFIDDDDDDAIFTAIETETIKEELDDSDDALFQRINTDMVTYTSRAEGKR